MRPAHSDRHTPSFPHRLICAQASVNRNGSSAMAGCPAVASTCAYRNVGVSTTRVRIPRAAATICCTSSSLSTIRCAVSIKADFTWSFTRSISGMVVPRNTVPSGSAGRVSSLMKVREPSSSVRTINEGNGCRAPGVGRLRTRPTSIESGPLPIRYGSTPIGSTEFAHRRLLGAIRNENSGWKNVSRSISRGVLPTVMKFSLCKSLALNK